MKIDLHLHTENSKNNGDSISWIGLNKVLKTLLSHGIKIASFTDHNAFNAKFYIEAKELANTGGLMLLPGIEVNVVRKNGTIAHMLIIFNNNLTSQELYNIEKIAKTIFKNGISINSINNLFNDFETIRIIHVGKGDSFSIEDIENLKFDAYEITNYEHSNYIRFKKQNVNSSIVAFSDTHIWDIYPQCNNLITDIFDLNTQDFNELRKCLNSNKNYTIIMR